MKKNICKRSLLCLLLSLIMVISLLPAGVSADGLAGSGTEESPYLIENADDLKAFRDMVNEADSSAAYAVLTDDIDLTGEEWTPINSLSEYATTAYAGVFDGDFHTITGLSVNASATNQGLFAVINGAEIKNLNVEGNVYSDKAYVGGIVGKVQQGKITNCSFTGTVGTGATGSSAYAGGITGYAGNSATQIADISGCVSNAAVTGGVAGGIAGYAKFTTITDCYNTGAISGSSRSGGIAGQLQNNCAAESCYNIGKVSGSDTASDICDFLYSSATLTNCWGKTQLSGAGTGTIESGGIITAADELLESLGSAFVEDENDVNDGYPVLSWQKNNAPVPKDPKISISGGSVLYMTNSGAAPQTTLSVNYTDMDAVPIVWSTDNDDVIITEAPADPDENNSKIIVKAKNPGTAVVTASTGDGAYTAEQEIKVMPFITTVEISGQTVVGQTVLAKVNVLGGYEYDYENYPELIYRWKYLTAEDYDAGNTGFGSYKDIPAATDRTFEITDDLVGDYLSFSILYNGEEKTPSSPVKILSVEEAENNAKREEMQQAAGSLGEYYKMYPVFGTDTNVIDILKSDLADKGIDYSGIDISIKSVEEIYGGAGIDSDGNITYFYADPNSMPAVKMGSYTVTFALCIGDAEFDFDVPVIIYWDRDKVKAVMKDEILDNVTDSSILGENSSLDHVTGNLSLPKVVDAKKWTLVSWSSSDENVLAISTENQETADTLFNPYVGVVKRGAEDKTVTLTATFTFMLTNDITGNEQPVTMNKVFDVTVKAVGSEQIEAIERELNAKLDAGFEKAGLTDSVTGEPLAFDGEKYTAYNDIQLPTTRDFGVDGKYYPVTLSSSDAALKTPDVNNAARVEVYRPAVGNDSANATLTVTITDTNSNISVSRTFDILVPAITSGEVESEKALMEKVKSSYFDGIKGENERAENISKSLNPFMEVYEESGELVWVRDSKDMANHGIVPIAMDGWEELEAWRCFRSSNPAAITHENLLVTMQKKAKAVTVSSALASETLGKYGKLYLGDPETYADYADLADLYYQEVSQELVVRGMSTPAEDIRPMAVEETVTVYFRLQSSDSTLIETTAYKNLDETLTVFDIFKQALSENGYTYKNRGSYVYSITTPDGITFEELDEGANSGWMYKVNGEIPEVNMGGYGLKNGDEILVYFTKDYMNGKYPSIKGTSSGTTGATSKTTSSGNQTDEEITTTEPEDKTDKTDETGKTDEAGSTEKVTDVSYNDISGHWAQSAIQYVSNLGIMQGVGNDEFAPDSSLTRAMFVTMLYRLENEPETELSAFVDIESGSWYEKAVAWANINGIVTGISDTEFAPDVNISREQIAVIIYRYAKFKGYESDKTVTDSYSDETNISGYAKEAVSWAGANSIMVGMGDGSFAPQRNTTRAESAAVFMRIIENLH